MRNILYVTASLMGDNSKSRQVANEFIAALRAKNPNVNVVERHLTPAGMPHLELETLGALMTAADQRTDEQKRRVAFADGLIEEVEAADTIVLAAPMYNFSIPTTLKAWIDHIARAGRTFRYTGVGTVEGQLKGRKVFAVLSRGGYYKDNNPMEFQETYLRSVLGFLGITDVNPIYIEGQNVSPEAAAKGLDEARASFGGLVPAALAA